MMNDNQSNGNVDSNNDNYCYLYNQNDEIRTPSSSITNRRKLIKSPILNSTNIYLNKNSFTCNNQKQQQQPQQI
jgi:hypothetical protein